MWLQVKAFLLVSGLKVMRALKHDSRASVTAALSLHGQTGPQGVLATQRLVRVVSALAYMLPESNAPLAMAGNMMHPWSE